MQAANHEEPGVPQQDIQDLNTTETPKDQTIVQNEEVHCEVKGTSEEIVVEAKKEETNQSVSKEAEVVIEKEEAKDKIKESEEEIKREENNTENLDSKNDKVEEIIDNKEEGKEAIKTGEEPLREEKVENEEKEEKEGNEKVAETIREKEVEKESDVVEEKEVKQEEQKKIQEQNKQKDSEDGDINEEKIPSCDNINEVQEGKQEEQEPAPDTEVEVEKKREEQIEKQEEEERDIENTDEKENKADEVQDVEKEVFKQEEKDGSNDDEEEGEKTEEVAENKEEIVETVETKVPVSLQKINESKNEESEREIQKEIVEHHDDEEREEEEREEEVERMSDNKNGKEEEEEHEEEESQRGREEEVEEEEQNQKKVGSAVEEVEDEEPQAIVNKKVQGYTKPQKYNLNLQSDSSAIDEEDLEEDGENKEEEEEEQGEKPELLEELDALAKNITEYEDEKGNEEEDEEEDQRDYQANNRTNKMARSSTIGGSFDNHYEKFCKEFLKKKEEAINKKRNDLLQEELSKLQEKPNITPINMSKPYVPLLDRTAVMNAKRERRLDKIRQEQEEKLQKELQELTFKPKINPKSRALIPPTREHIMGISSRPNTQRSAEENQHLFKPKINANSKSIAQALEEHVSKDVVDRLYFLADMVRNKKDQLAKKLIPKFTPTLTPNTHKIAKKMERNGSSGTFTNNKPGNERVGYAPDEIRMADGDNITKTSNQPQFNRPDDHELLEILKDFNSLLKQNKEVPFNVQQLSSLVAAYGEKNGNQEKEWHQNEADINEEDEEHAAEEHQEQHEENDDHQEENEGQEEIEEQEGQEVQEHGEYEEHEEQHPKEEIKERKLGIQTDHNELESQGQTYLEPPKIQEEGNRRISPRSLNMNKNISDLAAILISNPRSKSRNADTVTESNGSERGQELSQSLSKNLEISTEVVNKHLQKVAEKPLEGTPTFTTPKKTPKPTSIEDITSPKKEQPPFLKSSYLNMDRNAKGRGSLGADLLSNSSQKLEVNKSNETGEAKNSLNDSRQTPRSRNDVMSRLQNIIDNQQTKEDKLPLPLQETPKGKSPVGTRKEEGETPNKKSQSKLGSPGQQRPVEDHQKQNVESSPKKSMQKSKTISMKDTPQPIDLQQQKDERSRKIAQQLENKKASLYKKATMDPESPSKRLMKKAESKINTGLKKSNTMAPAGEQILKELDSHQNEEGKTGMDPNMSFSVNTNDQRASEPQGDSKLLEELSFEENKNQKGNTKSKPISVKKLVYLLSSTQETDRSLPSASGKDLKEVAEHVVKKFKEYDAQIKQSIKEHTMPVSASSNKPLQDSQETQGKDMKDSKQETKGNTKGNFHATIGYLGGGQKTGVKSEAPKKKVY